MKTPRWLLEETAPVSRGRRELKKTFINRAEKTSRKFLSEFLLINKPPVNDGLLQKLDPRIKMASLLFLLVALSLSTTIPVILGIYVAILATSFISRLDIGKYLRVTLVPTIVFSMPFVLPVTLNLVTPGKPILFLANLPNQILWLTPPTQLTITNTGLVMAATFFTRALAMLSATQLVMRTTPPHLAFASLSALRIPKLAVLLLRMTYRYLFILTELTNNVFLARKSRTIRTGDAKSERAWAAGRIGWIFKRSVYLGDQVTTAMISRGWTGGYNALPLPALKRADWLAMGCLAVVVTASVVF